MKRATVRITANFEANLEGIRRHHEEAETEPAFEALLDDLFATILPTLEGFPRIGPDLLARAPGSIEGLARVTALRKRLGDKASIRQYIHGDHLVLYALVDRRIYLLAIKHHRQLSFDLRRFWST